MRVNGYLLNLSCLPVHLPGGIVVSKNRKYRMMMDGLMTYTTLLLILVLLFRLRKNVLRRIKCSNNFCSLLMTADVSTLNFAFCNAHLIAFELDLREYLHP